MELICCLLTSFGATRPANGLMNFSLFVNHKRWKMHEHSHSKAINIQRWRVSRTTATESSLWTWNDLWFVYTSLLRIDFSCWTLCGTWFVPRFIAKRRLSAGDVTWSIFLFHHYHRGWVYTHLSAALISTFRRAFLHRTHENCKRNAMNPLGNRFYVCLEPITDERHKRFSRNENVSSRI